MHASFYPDLEARGLVHQTTSDEVRRLLAGGPVAAYIGFDPTADSLHVGSLLPVLALMRLQRAGHRAIAVVGGGTGMIGDPSGKTSERTMLDRAQIDANVAGLRAQLGRFLDFSGAHAARLVDNSDWLVPLRVIEFLRDVGKHFSVNAMIQRDSVQLRLEGREHGISFTEFTYALLQAYDFLELYDRFGCQLQLGGSDQWGNILDGCELIRRLRQGVAFGLTMPLVTRGDGSKFGKSEAGNVWIDAARTSPFSFYQFWLNTDDADVVRYLNFFTFLGADEIAGLAALHAAHPERREAHRALAASVTGLVHGADALESARRTTTVLFEGGDLRTLSPAELVAGLGETERAPLASAELAAGLELAAALVRCKLATSKGQARTSIQQGAISVNHEIVREEARLLQASDLLAGRFIVLRRGKKSYALLDLAE
ncbi:MAG TPA: tyrosine--tRNA ligase [Casimicrobiaceae bacterium]|nr:tyrosine--tRNA ligase [Casimicrobiaceae bacterium]